MKIKTIYTVNVNFFCTLPNLENLYNFYIPTTNNFGRYLPYQDQWVGSAYRFFKKFKETLSHYRSGIMCNVDCILAHTVFITTNDWIRNLLRIKHDVESSWQASLQQNYFCSGKTSYATCT